MGFDLYGKRAKNKRGEYFRANVWWWRKLWEFICMICEDILSEKDKDSGCFNNGHLINKTKAEAIAERIKISIKDATAKHFAETTKSLQKKAEIYNKESEANPGNKDHDWNADYPFTVTFLKEFMDFAKNSGGFTIC